MAADLNVAGAILPNIPLILPFKILRVYDLLGPEHAIKTLERPKPTDMCESSH